MSDYRGFLPKEDHKMFSEEKVVSNTYENDIEEKYYVMANFLIENQYPVNTDDPVALAEFLRKKELEVVQNTLEAITEPEETIQDVIGANSNE